MRIFHCNTYSAYDVQTIYDFGEHDLIAGAFTDEVTAVDVDYINADGRWRNAGELSRVYVLHSGEPCLVRRNDGRHAVASRLNTQRHLRRRGQPELIELDDQ